jgi:predicted RNase H-like HicB family nuclease
MRTARLKLEIEPLCEGGFMVTSPEVPQLVAWGASMDEAMRNAGDVARSLLSSLREHADPVPAALAALDDADDLPKKIEVLLPVEAA